MKDNSTKLKRMATWTIVVFATVFAVFMTLFWMLNAAAGGSSLSILGAALTSGWLIFVVAAVLCLGAYYGYKLYLSRQK